MENRIPKRRKEKDNPYTIKYDDFNQTYQLMFHDSKGKIQTISITEEVYDAFNQFELEDLSQMNRYDRHIEHLEQTDEFIFQRAVLKEKNLEEEVFEKMLYQEVRQAIQELPEIQKRRLEFYYFKNMTLEEIARVENCTHRAIKFSIDLAIKKLKEKLKK